MILQTSDFLNLLIILTAILVSLAKIIMGKFTLDFFNEVRLLLEVQEIIRINLKKPFHLICNFQSHQGITLASHKGLSLSLGLAS